MIPAAADRRLPAATFTGSVVVPLIYSRAEKAAMRDAGHGILVRFRGRGYALSPEGPFHLQATLERLVLRCALARIDTPQRRGRPRYALAEWAS